MKVLIISHNPLSQQSNMGKTLCSLFSEFRPEELCQFYIYPTVPNVAHCGSYYRITDKDALRGVLHGRCVGSRQQVQLNAGMYETAADAKWYSNRRNHSALRELMRDDLWRCAGWYGETLRIWLEQEAPDCIFVAPGGAKFLYDFALEIGKEREIPIVTYLCDEYYFCKTPLGRWDRCRHRLLKKKMETLMARTSHLVTICKELAEPYKKTFGVPTTVLMTGATIAQSSCVKIVQNRDAISYFGNIRCERYRALAEIGAELDAINAELGTTYRLKIYTAEQNAQILSALRSYQSVELPGFLQGDAFVSELENAQILLHVEAFGAESAELVKHSVSTKIADSLASGIPLLAYGPSSVASMAHLRRNGCAILAEERQALRGALLTAFTEEEICRRVAENGLQTAQKYHNREMVSRKLRDVIEGCV